MVQPTWTLADDSDSDSETTEEDDFGTMSSGDICCNWMLNDYDDLVNENPSGNVGIGSFGINDSLEHTFEVDGNVRFHQDFGMDKFDRHEEDGLRMMLVDHDGEAIEVPIPPQIFSFLTSLDGRNLAYHDGSKIFSWDNHYEELNGEGDAGTTSDGLLAFCEQFDSPFCDFAVNRIASCEVDEDFLNPPRWQFGISYDHGAGFEEEKQIWTCPDANVGIGEYFPKRALHVNGTPYFSEGLDVDGEIRAHSIKVTDLPIIPDYVFEDDYDLMPLNSFDKYIENNHSLPHIPTNEEVKENNNSVNLSDMQLNLLKQLEEQALYILELHEEKQNLQEELEDLRDVMEEVNSLESRLEKLENDG